MRHGEWEKGLDLHAVHGITVAGGVDCVIIWPDGPEGTVHVRVGVSPLRYGCKRVTLPGECEDAISRADEATSYCCPERTEPEHAGSAAA